ncbi:alpha/beta fold hydrolase [Caldimonas tepidiphila]|uniref:alpha/beta fold hydrolase n=1 Tax=Caldimonas tepidiphila TaxID=2315841 RepID=UPI000E5A5218|nr:alpha/beta hydrolase [Caldimonas tepidiphila]
MTQLRLDHVQCLDGRGLHRMAYWEWGDPANPRVLVCAHGLTRQGRDFDALAAALCDEWRVVCPDVVGRGHSDWLADPAGYQVPAYVADMVTLLARLNARTVDWVGTSMGGLIGMALASLPGSPLRRLVLNDVGPALNPAGLMRIAGYVGQAPRFASEQEGVDHLVALCQPFGEHTSEQWQALQRPMLRPLDEAQGGGWRLHYDPRIGEPFRLLTPELLKAGEAAAWQRWDALRLPTLLIRGAHSDLLGADAARQMGERGPCAQLLEVADAGHAPTLVAPAQIARVREFLASA